MDANRTPSAADLLAVKSRVSWGALAAGAMVALTIYIILTLLGVALGVELAVRGDDRLGAGTAIYSIVVLLLAMFFGGWATSRLAVGESKTEAVLYGLILWGVLFIGMVWLLSAGLRTGFGAMVGTASGVYASEDDGRIDVDRVARDLKRAGADDTTVEKYRRLYERVRDDPAAAGQVGREMSSDPDVRRAGGRAAEGARQATWWTLLGVLTSLGTVIFGTLVGSGELLQPVPILGVRREPRRPTV